MLTHLRFAFMAPSFVLALIAFTVIGCETEDANSVYSIDTSDTNVVVVKLRSTGEQLMAFHSNGKISLVLVGGISNASPGGSCAVTMNTANNFVQEIAIDGPQLVRYRFDASGAIVDSFRQERHEVRRKFDSIMRIL